MIIITTIVSLLFIATIIWTAISPSPESMLWLKYAVLGTIIATVIGVLAYIPMRLNVDREYVSVSRLSGTLRIPINEIRETRKVTKSYIGNSIRTFGSGGFMGYLGKFRHKTDGNYTMYATNLDEIVLIRTNNKKYIFSCTNATKFIESVERLSDC